MPPLRGLPIVAIFPRAPALAYFLNAPLGLEMLTPNRILEVANVPYRRLSLLDSNRSARLPVNVLK
jgi:hypothetical protein